LFGEAVLIEPGELIIAGVVEVVEFESECVVEVLEGYELVELGGVEEEIAVGMERIDTGIAGDEGIAFKWISGGGGRSPRVLASLVSG
jgi:hypothetical protein